MSKKIKYIFPQEILDKVWKPLDIKVNTNIINDNLIELRRNYLKFTNDEKKLSFKLMHFNKIVKTKEEDLMVNIIKMYLKLDEINKSKF